MHEYGLNVSSYSFGWGNKYGTAELWCDILFFKIIFEFKKFIPCVFVFGYEWPYNDSKFQTHFSWVVPYEGQIAST